MCIMKPETCHYHEGTCREPEWADSHCMQEHVVYLANSSGIKVGITRGDQVPTRWIDQGASQAIEVFRVRNRYHSGLIEVILKQQVNDRTDWRRMLKGPPEPLDMVALREQVTAAAMPHIEALGKELDGFELERRQTDPVEIDYPVETYPEKVASLNFDTQPEVSGALMGIKGQYLILDTGVINIRKFGGYEIEVDDD